MFSCKTCKSDDREEDQHDNISEAWEHKLLGEIGMQQIRDYEIYDSLFIYPDGEIGYVHTIEAGEHDAQPLVLIHGYGSGAVFYYKMIAELRHKFHVYAIDLNGMGSSSRRPITNFDFNNVVNFFIDALELWRLKIGLKNFVLMGHSMGGYISSHWVKLKNPPIKLLYLLSPAGFTNKDDETLKENAGFFKGLGLKVYDYFLHENKVNPFSYMVFRDYLLEKKFTGKRLNLPPKEGEYVAKYFGSTLDKTESGERAVGVLLRFAKYSNYPICQILHEIRHDQGFSYPIVVIYREKDWMDYEHSIEQNMTMDLRLEITFIPNCDHQIILQNPSGLCHRMLQDQAHGYDNIHKVDI